ncbi:M24 family metallopeptidase [Meiothermus rufus]|uniref:M24 family metallopeptidase n=1 Tax=Meiothermus rufus TaxID=604332 RepID=UPI000415ADC1|nr:M24 family metallopeptidase [Meiothermus rufus]
MPEVNFVPHPIPPIEQPREIPLLPAELFQQRYLRLEAAREKAGYDALIIYADREHAANLGWLTDFTPRFEEALWVQVGGQTPTLLVGNECLHLAPALCKLEARYALYQEFSLPGQDRSQSPGLATLLRQAGLGRGLQVGLIGWKPMPNLEVPHWIVQAIEEVTGQVPQNANALLMSPENGLRRTLEPEQIRFAEYASALSSEGVRRWVFALREGQSELESAKSLVSYGLELSCHPMVNFGPHIPSGLKSPRNQRVEEGFYAQVAFGLVGGLTCRAGWLVRSSHPKDADGYLELARNYLQVVWAWYATLGIGVEAGKAYQAAATVKGSGWDFALNPGHLIHLEEWLESPFKPGATLPLESGMAIQQDIIPLPKHGRAVVNMEDGLVLADRTLRARLWQLDPSLMQRVEQRQQLMETLGYQLSEDVLPLSNIQGVFFPFLLEPSYVACFK